MREITDLTKEEKIKVAENCINILKKKAAAEKTYLYALFGRVDGWSYDKANYYLRRDPRKISDMVVGIVKELCGCTDEEIFNGV